MRVVRAVGIGLLSLVDAAVAGFVIGTLVYAFWPYFYAPGGDLMALSLGGLASLATLVVGAALTATGSGPFPFTRAVKRVLASL